jgi:putative endonuclease
VKRGPGVLAHTQGIRGEERAAEHLKGQGYLILSRNFKTRIGEIDIVAQDGETTVFVEVKRRETGGHGGATEFVDPAKRRKVVATARIYAARHGLSNRLLRFDVIAIDLSRGSEQLRHHKGAFDAR